MRRAIEIMIATEFTNKYGDVFEYALTEEFRDYGIVDAITELFKKFPEITEYTVLSEDFEDTTNYATGVVFIAWIEDGKLETMTYKWVSY